MIDQNRIIETLPLKSPNVDRRRHTRWTLERPCKLRRVAGVSFESAKTVNVAPGGVRVVVSGEKRFAVGDRIEMAVAWDGEPVLGPRSLLVGRVLRITGTEAEQSLAIQFEQPMSLDASVLDPAA